ncbi:MAG: carboxypeptidase-like regulatory domain-containing protein [bacterium]
MNRIVLASLVILVAATLAGCSGKSAPTHDDVIRSIPSGDEVVVPDPVISGSGRGSLLGLVTNPANVAVQGASVELGGTDIFDITAKNGTFFLQDVPEGTYGIIARADGYAPATGTVIIRADTTQHTWVQLALAPPPPPFHKTLFYNGTITVTTDPMTGFSDFSCAGCYASLPVGKGVKTIVLEFTMNKDGIIPVQPFPDPLDLANRSVYWRVYNGQTTAWSGSGPNPLLERTSAVKTGNYTLNIDPTTYPFPETSKTFTIYVTIFYWTPAPTIWSYLQGDR